MGFVLCFVFYLLVCFFVRLDGSLFFGCIVFGW